MNARRRWKTPVGVLVVIAVVAVVAFVATRDSEVSDLLGSRAASAATTTTTMPTTTTPAAPPTATRLLALPSRNIVNGTAPLTVKLSGAPAASSPPPTLSPAVAGSWSVVGDAEVFKPVSTLEPCSSYALTVWAQTDATGSSDLGTRQTIGLKVACPPLAGLQQALAHLGYLGASFHPRYEVKLPSGRETRAEAALHAYHPPRGALVPEPSDAPPVEIGHLDATTRGALTVYQDDHDLEATGEPDSETWASILAAETDYKRDPIGYTWVSVTESLPETLEVHEGKRVAFTTPANTGVPGAETEQGIFPIYSRLLSTTMTGEDVDGEKYDVSDVPWVNYFNGGDAVHGYPRASYGFPQSNGCVELPIEASKTVFGMLALGDIVWVR
jgi:hypothetical protein